MDRASCFLGLQLLRDQLKVQKPRHLDDLSRRCDSGVDVPRALPSACTDPKASTKATTSGPAPFDATVIAGNDECSRLR